MSDFPKPINNVIQLSADEYVIPSRVSIPKDCKILGPATGRAVVRPPTNASTADGETLYIQGNNVLIQGNIDFKWGGIYRDGRVAGCVIDGPRFLNIRPTGKNPQGNNKHTPAITSYNSTGLTIRNCYFEDVAYGCWVADESDVEIHNNELLKSGYGFKVFGDGDNNEWHAWANWIHDVGPDFMGYEWQGRCRNWSLESNLSERIAIGSTRDQNDHTLFHSLPMAKSDGNGRVRFNVLLGSKPNNGLHIPMGFEVGGGVKGDSSREVLYEGNYVNGANNAFDVTDRDATARIRFRNNGAFNVNKAISWNASTQEIIQEGKNGSDAPPPFGLASWDLQVAAVRAKAGIQGSAPPIVTPPIDPCASAKAERDKLAVELTAARAGELSEKAGREAAESRLEAIRLAGGW